MAQLEVNITGDAKGLENELKDVQKALIKTEQVAGKAVSGIEKPLKQGGKSVKDFGKQTANAVPVVTEFSRVIQDAPFGIRGVANNIQQLTGNFANLQKQTGGTRAALKAVVTGLTGPTGVLLAVSAVTALLVQLSNKGITLSSILNKNARSFNEFAKEAKDALGSAKAEITTLNELVAVARDDAQSRERRQRAINQLNKDYGKYLGNLSLENINTAKVRDRINEVSKALIAQAKVRGAQSLLEKKAAEFAEKEIKLREKASQAYDNFVDNVVAGNTRRIASEESGAKAAEKQASILAAALEGGADAAAQAAGVISREDFIANAIADQVEKSKEALKPFETFLKTFLSDTLDFDLAAPEVGGIRGLQQLETDIQALNAIQPLGIAAVSESLKGLGVDALSAQQTVSPALKSINEDLLKFNEDATQIIQTGIANTFSGLASVIGTALVQSENIAEALGRSLLASIGSVLVQLGELAIATGIGLLGVKAALATLNPAVAIAAGAALVAIGSAFSAGARGLAGGIGGGGTPTTPGPTPTTRTSGFATSTIPTEQTVVFEIAGTKLVGVLSRTLQRNARLGGGQIVLNSGG